MSENKQCPFCGADPALKRKDESRVHARCSNAECWASDWSMPISAWNTRVEKKAPILPDYTVDIPPGKFEFASKWPGIKIHDVDGVTCVRNQRVDLSDETATSIRYRLLDQLIKRRDAPPGEES